MTIQLEGVKISELFASSQADCKAKVDKLFEAALDPSKSQLKRQAQAIDERITKFERRYEMSSATMRRKLRAGEIKETADICSWVMLLKARENIESEST